MTMYYVAAVLSIIVVYTQQQQSSCPNGYQLSAVVSNKCFRIVTELQNFFNAHAYCRNATTTNEGNMISIGSGYENGDIYCNIV